MDSSAQVSHFSGRDSTLSASAPWIYPCITEGTLTGGSWETAKAVFQSCLWKWIPFPEMVFCFSPIGQRSWRVTVLKASVVQSCRPLLAGHVEQETPLRQLVLTSPSPLCNIAFLYWTPKVNSELPGTLCMEEIEKNSTANQSCCLST